MIHAFQKKSKRGIATPKKEIDLIRKQLKQARQLAQENEVMQLKKKGDIEYYEGSGNVYTDLGFENPEGWATKAHIATKIFHLIEERQLTQKQAGEIFGIAQGRVSDLKRGQFDKFSVEKLLSFLNTLGQDVDIVIRPKVTETAHIQVMDAVTA